MTPSVFVSRGAIFVFSSYSAVHVRLPDGKDMISADAMSLVRFGLAGPPDN